MLLPGRPAPADSFDAMRATHLGMPLSTWSAVAFLRLSSRRFRRLQHPAPHLHYGIYGAEGALNPWPQLQAGAAASTPGAAAQPRR